MKSILYRIYSFLLLSCTTLLVAGCKSGGGGGSLGFLGDVGGSSSSTVYTAASAGSFATVVNPEPSSLILLGSGLVGMAIYAKAHLKSKSKR